MIRNNQRLTMFFVFIVFCTSCGLQNEKEKKININGFNIVEEDRTINFVFPEHCLNPYKTWFEEMNGQGLRLNTNIYKITPTVQFQNLKYNAMLNSEKLSNIDLWTAVEVFLRKNCYGDRVEKIDAKNLFFKDQDLATIYELEVPITNIQLNGSKIEVYFNERLLNKRIEDYKSKIGK